MPEHRDRPNNVSCPGQLGEHILTQSITARDPQRKYWCRDVHGLDRPKPDAMAKKPRTIDARKVSKRRGCSRLGLAAVAARADEQHHPCRSNQ
jgi:hypothetical protein